MKRIVVSPPSAPASRAKNLVSQRFFNLLIFIILSFFISSCSNDLSPLPNEVNETPKEAGLEPSATPETSSEHPETETPVSEDIPTIPTFETKLFGSYTYGGVWSGMAPIYELETNLGQRLDIVHWFMSWNNSWDENLVNSASQGGRLPMISWEAVGAPLEEIAAGHYDSYIQSWAEGIKAHEGLVYLRPFPEMNGEWTPWNGQPELFVAVWRRMVTIFDEAGTQNVRWVWAPNVTDEPRIDSNLMELYYPGEAYVDVLALDGYNWGTSRTWSEWTRFEDVFAQPYERIAKLGNQPIWLAEVASSEDGGNKAQWISEMFESTAFPRLEALVWFNEDKETSWNVDSSDAAIQAFQQSLASETLFAGIGQ